MKVEQRDHFVARKRTAKVIAVQLIAFGLAMLPYSLFAFLTTHVWGMGAWLGFPMWVLAIWLLYPRFIGFPPEPVVYDAQSFPVLNEIVAQISGILGVPAPTIFMTEQHVAASARLGWRRRAVIRVGHPLLATLTATELVQVLTHEIAHAYDKAVTRSLPVRIAYAALYRWEKLFCPQRVGLLLKPFTFALYWLLRPIYLVLKWCISVDHKEAEHWVDSIAVQMSGACNSTELHLKFTLGQHPLFDNYGSVIPEQKYHLARRAYETLSADVCAQIKAHMLTEKTLLHPLIAERLVKQTQIPVGHPNYRISPTQYHALHQELKAWPCIIAKREAALR